MIIYSNNRGGGGILYPGLYENSGSVGSLERGVDKNSEQFFVVTGFILFSIITIITRDIWKYIISVLELFVQRFELYFHYCY